MKLDVGVLRYLTKDDFRTLTAVELGMKNHDLVPTELIASLSALKPSTAFRCIGTLHKHKLVFHSSQKYDGYRLTYMGYDYLALRALLSRGSIAGVGRRVGVGKESDVYEVVDPDGRELILKLHRLGRISFRAIKSKRDYMGSRKSASWLYMSRLAANREFVYIKALHKRSFPVPTPIDWNRHAVLMTRAQGYPLYQIRELAQPDEVMRGLMQLIVRLASYGLVHGDFNEFNLLIEDDMRVTLIDFPQMISTSHANAEMQFDRDVECVHTFFKKRLNYCSTMSPKLHVDTLKRVALDVELSASGHSSEESKEFDDYLRTLKEEEGDCEMLESDFESSEELSRSEGDADSRILRHEEAGEIQKLPTAIFIEESGDGDNVEDRLADLTEQCNLSDAAKDNAAVEFSQGEDGDGAHLNKDEEDGAGGGIRHQPSRSQSLTHDSTIDMEMVRARVKSRLQKVAALRATRTSRAARRRKVQARHSMRQRVKTDIF